MGNNGCNRNFSVIVEVIGNVIVEVTVTYSNYRTLHILFLSTTTITTYRVSESKSYLHFYINIGTLFLCLRQSQAGNKK